MKVDSTKIFIQNNSINPSNSSNSDTDQSSNYLKPFCEGLTVCCRKIWILFASCFGWRIEEEIPIEPNLIVNENIEYYVLDKNLPDKKIQKISKNDVETIHSIPVTYTTAEPQQPLSTNLPTTLIEISNDNNNPQEHTEPKQIYENNHAGIENYKASSCYLASTLQAFKSCSQSQILTEKSDAISQLYKEIFTSLKSENTIDIETTKSWIKKAISLKLTPKKLGEHGDPTDIIHATLENLYKGQSCGLQTKRKEKLLNTPTPFRTIMVQRIKGSIDDEIEEIPSLQEIIDGKTDALTPTRVESDEKAPPFVAFSLNGRSNDKEYIEKEIAIPTELKIKANDKEKVAYRLSSSIMFAGKSASGKGNHYYTYVLKGEDDKGIKTWVEYNDSVVKERVDHDKKIQKMVEKRGYVLFYSKV